MKREDIPWSRILSLLLVLALLGLGGWAGLGSDALAALLAQVIGSADLSDVEQIDTGDT